MDLTSTFNSSAAGPEGEATAVESGGPQILDGGAAAAVERREKPETTEHGESTLSAVATPAESAVDAQTSAPDASRAQPPSVDEVRAELAALESARSTPEPHHNLKPPRHLEQIVHTEVERERELRISALNAYLEHTQSKPEREARHEFRDQLEPAL